MNQFRKLAGAKASREFESPPLRTISRLRAALILRRGANVLRQHEGLFADFEIVGQGRILGNVKVNFRPKNIYKNLTRVKDIRIRPLIAWIKGRRVGRALLIIAVLICAFLIILYVLDRSLLKKYQSLESVVVQDRHGETISVKPNAKGEYSEYEKELPTRFKELLIKKEDRFFSIHPGINPASISRALFRSILGRDPGGSSTITQQLAKNLLGNENKRTISNKAVELLYSLSLEMFHTKETILSMYANTVYMGNNIQGFGEAAKDYFGKEVNEISESEFVSLLATLSHPGTQNPWKKMNKEAAESLAEKLGVDFNPVIKINDAPDTLIHNSPTSFEFDSLGYPCKASCTTTLDKELTEKLRDILKRNVALSWNSGARNGAIVVIKVPENEILAIVGSPYPSSTSNGYSINMAIEPRPIGSTAKPFIYLEAFKKGLRPYSLVLDREYKYPIATGYSLYPKNYDGLYHGLVTLHKSLSNSYNVPTVKTLEYVGLSDFYDFLENTLGFTPLRDLDSYQYGIALGGLEMDPLTLAYYFSLFPEKGTLKPLRLFLENKSGESSILPPMCRLLATKQVSEPKYVELVTKVLNDRKAGVEQFGLESSLNLTQDNYAVKTGTSRDYHDSWTVGYTPDYVVLSWLGNAENEPLKQISGQSGAGRIWNEVMELLAASEYNRKTQFSFNSIKSFLIDGNLDFGLEVDTPTEHRDLLQESDLIIFPHKGETVLFEPGMVVPLRSSKEAEWSIDSSYLGSGSRVDFSPSKIGSYRIQAKAGNQTETITLRVSAN